MDISVIIPTFNEAMGLAQTIERTRNLGPCEIIVVDGGSNDGTLDVATKADHCLTSSRGRAVQQNTGATASLGDALLFLHADCWLEEGAFDALRLALADEHCVAGCFLQTIDADGWSYRLIEQGNALRVRWLKWAYGDQAMFVRRDVFQRVGGFPEMELMEDLYLSKRLKREGQVQLVDHRLHVSPRRWQRMGLVRQTLRNWAFVSLAQCGVSPHLLANHYANIR